MIRFVDEHRDRFGVEPLISVLRATDAGFLSVSGYYAAKTRPPSARQIADAALCEQISAVHEANYSVYGVRKMRSALHRAGVPVGRDHLARLMRQLGLAGVRRGRPKRTTIADSAAARPADLVRRQFHAARPNQLWVCDLTYIRTWVGFAYLALVVDVYSRRLVGWALTTHLRTDLPLEALEMAVWARNDRLDGLIHHSDAGSQHLAIRYTDTLAGVGALPSVGSVGDSYDCGRVHHRSDQGRVDPPPRTVAHGRTAGIRPAGVHRLEPPPSARPDRHAHPRRNPGRLLRSTPATRRGDAVNELSLYRSQGASDLT